MKLIKPSASLITEFRAMAPQLSHGQLRKMFGYDAVFVNGNMAVGLWQNTCVVKVSPADQALLLQRGLAVPFAPMKGRAMTGWLELSEELAHDPEELLAWSQRAVTFIAALPPKVRSGEKTRPKGSNETALKANKSNKKIPARASKETTPRAKTANEKTPARASKETAPRAKDATKNASTKRTPRQRAPAKSVATAPKQKPRQAQKKR